MISFPSTNQPKVIYTRLSQRYFIICLTSRFTPKIKRVLNVGAKNSLSRKTYELRTEGKVLNWFNQVNASQISPTQRRLFGITTCSHDTTIIRKFNYTALFMCHYIYSAKLNSLAISFQDFISKLLIKHNLESLS